MKTFKDLLEAKKPSAKDLKKAKAQAKAWSLDDDNNYGEAVVTFFGGHLRVAADASPGMKIVAKFIDGKEVSVN